MSKKSGAPRRTAGSARNQTDRPARSAPVKALALAPDAEDARADVVEPSFKGIASAISRLIVLVRHRYMPQLWDYRDIAEWMKVSETTVKIRVVTQPGFPEPFVPTGNEEGHKRYFSDEVMAFARKNRGARLLRRDD